MHIVVERRIYSGREGYILGGSNNIIVVEKGGYILRGRGRFWESRTYTLNFVVFGRYLRRRGRYRVRRTYKLVEKGGIFWEGGVDSGRVAFINWLKKGVYSGREG